MTVTFELPREIEESLGREVRDLGQAAKEAFLVDLYRREMVTREQLSAALGVGWYETEGVLKRHGVMLDYRVEDLEADRKTLAELLKSGR
jgi:predicted HTH domain antitoxin